jgi:hypothetical protein
LCLSYQRGHLNLPLTFGCQTTVAAAELSFFYFRKNENRKNNYIYKNVNTLNTHIKKLHPQFEIDSDSLNVLKNSNNQNDDKISINSQDMNINDLIKNVNPIIDKLGCCVILILRTLERR